MTMWRKTGLYEEQPDGRLFPVYVADTIDVPASGPWCATCKKPTRMIHTNPPKCAECGAAQR